ncbi:metal-dependent hydrolase [Meiothermus sp. QL-1]|uniref:metal-dependent hydrolase n=1 Tax=Meiothermus sp. QL-1 TaxID=2058095 RepID=UPI000E0ABF27|nr:metal-dependent hydrolase [Meiothermus sp. QL-1]RDI95082.1 metal-dependent hydrolase [Meiothermus sp. QL-1]
MLEVRYLGHSALLITDGTTRVLVDPFLTGNPKAALAADQVEADLIVLTHAHGDHYGDSVAISQRTGAPIISNYEIVSYAERQGAKGVGMNLGGTYRFSGGWLKWFPAWHSSSFPDGTYGGLAQGCVLELAGKRLYIAGDTALFSDMSLLASYAIDLAVLPIGDHFTMGPDDALKALELIRAKQVLPVHYNTFPPIAQDGAAFVRRAGLLGIGGEALEPGGQLRL